MGQPAVQVFIGDELQVQSERDFLAQVESDLEAAGLRAVILANFFTRSGSRQVDFLVATDAHACHVELKSYDYVLTGSVNGVWSSRRDDGSAKVIDRQNPYHQALGCKMAISDDMGALAARDARIPQPAGGRKFFTRLDSVVCVFPRLADGSEVPSDYKVRTLGYREFFAFLASPGANPGWRPEHWEAFIRDHSLVSVRAADDEGMHQTSAVALVSEYRRRFDAFHRHGLHELVPVPWVRDGEAVTADMLPGMAESAGHVQVTGPSGSGKSHLLRHALLRTEASVLPVIVEAGMYEGRLSALIDRSVARFITTSARELLRAAAVCGHAVLLAVDGLNECPERLREALAGDMSAFCLRTGARTITTAQAGTGLPADLTGIAVQADSLGDADRRAVLASYGAEVIMPFCDPFTTPYELSVAAACAAELNGTVTRGALFSSYIRRQLSGTRNPAPVRDALRQLALSMDEKLATWLPLDEVWRTSEEHLALCSAPVSAVDEVLRSTLVRTSQGRLSFAHEFLGRFLTMEALRRDRPGPHPLAAKLRLPRHADLPRLAVETETDPATLAALMVGLADPRVYTAALRGKVGNLALRTVRDAAARLLATITDELPTTTFTIHDQFEATIVGGSQLAEADNALLSAVGTLAAEGYFTREIAALLDSTDAACERSADIQQYAEGKKPSPSLIVSAVLSPFFTNPPRPRAAASVLLGAAETAWAIGPAPSADGRRHASSRVIADLLEGATSGSHGRLLLLCYLVRAADGLDVATLIPQLLRLCWASRAYHIMLDSLTAVRSFAVAVQDHPLHGEIADALAECSTSNWALSSMLTETLAAYGLIEPPYDEEIVRADVNQALDDPAAQESRELAYSVVCNQFEDVVAAPFVAVIDGLAPERRTLLYILASLGSPHYGFWSDWLLENLLESEDPRALPAYERWATSFRTDTSSPREAARCYMLGVCGWAQLMPDPPELDGSADSDARAAWECYGAIIFWLHRPGTDPEEASCQCAPHWQRLNADLLHAAADPLYWLDMASWFPREGQVTVTNRILCAFPGEVRPILEWSVQHAGEAVTAFRHPLDDRAKTFVGMLAVVGNADSGEILRAYADDAKLGASAIAAIKYLGAKHA
jgi:hypothetical protein